MTDWSAKTRTGDPLRVRAVAALLGIVLGGVLSWWIGHRATSAESYFNVISIAYLLFVGAIPTAIGFVLVLARPALGTPVKWFLLSALSVGVIGLFVFQYQQSRELVGTVQVHIEGVQPVDWSGSARCMTTQHYSNRAISEVWADQVATLDGQPVWVNFVLSDQEGNAQTGLRMGQPMNDSGFAYREYASEGPGLTVSTSGDRLTGRMDFKGLHGGPVPLDLQGKPMVVSGHITWGCSNQDYHPS